MIFMGPLSPLLLKPLLMLDERVRREGFRLGCCNEVGLLLLLFLKFRLSGARPVWLRKDVLLRL